MVDGRGDTGQSIPDAPPWYRQVTADQWRAFWATFLEWVSDIQRTFTVDSFLAGILGTVTLMMRLVGGARAGTAADRWGAFARALDSGARAGEPGLARTAAAPARAARRIGYRCCGSSSAISC